MARSVAAAARASSTRTRSCATRTGGAVRACAGAVRRYRGPRGRSRRQLGTPRRQTLHPSRSHPPRARRFRASRSLTRCTRRSATTPATTLRPRRATRRSPRTTTPSARCRSPTSLRRSRSASRTKTPKRARSKRWSNRTTPPTESARRRCSKCSRAVPTRACEPGTSSTRPSHAGAGTHGRRERRSRSWRSRDSSCITTARSSQRTPRSGRSCSAPTRCSARRSRRSGTYSNTRSSIGSRRPSRARPVSAACESRRASRIAARCYQPYPSVQLSLKDRWEEAVGSRVFAPAEYLAAEPRKLMAPGETTRAELEIVDPGQDAYGFELDVCIEVESITY